MENNRSEGNPPARLRPGGDYLPEKNLKPMRFHPPHCSPSYKLAGTGDKTDDLSSLSPSNHPTSVLWRPSSVLCYLVSKSGYQIFDTPSFGRDLLKIHMPSPREEIKLAQPGNGSFHCRR